MHYKDRIPEELFEKDGHFLGRPADYGDRIVSRRIALVEDIDGFTGPQYDLLDIGCGNGASLFLLASKMQSCTGIEISDAYRNDFTAYASTHGISNCSYVVSNIEKEAPLRQYDRIISFEVIEHLKEEDSLRYYYNALKSGGLMAISVPNKWWIFETHGARLPLLPWNRVPFFSWLPRCIHDRFSNARIYTKQRICRLLEKHGFRILDVKYIMAPMDVLPEGKLKHWIIRHFFNKHNTCIPCKATSIFVVAKKK